MVAPTVNFRRHRKSGFVLRGESRPGYFAAEDAPVTTNKLDHTGQGLHRKVLSEHVERQCSIRLHLGVCEKQLAIRKSTGQPQASLGLAGKHRPSLAARDLRVTRIA